MQASGALLRELDRRGLVAQATPGLDDHLQVPRSLYCGFDPTADSLHIGSLVPLLALRRFQLAGHRPIALIGGATGLVGDPSFKAEERQLNAAETVRCWGAAIRAQIEGFLQADGPGRITVVDNLEWLRDARLLDFLRDVGKHFSVSAMIRKDSVRQRIEREGEGISFAEFSYALLQAYDYAELNRRFDCTLQLGGSDQWGNITGGIELCRRQNRAQAHALTLPLVTRSDGSKFGKTESGTVWLDARRTSPYAFFQFWINVADADVYRFLRYFTFLPVEDIDRLEMHAGEPAGRPVAQRVLAEEVTRLVHGDAGCRSATRIADALFGGQAEQLEADDFVQLAQDGLPCSTLGARERQLPLTTLLVEVGLASSGKQVKDALGRAAVSVNGQTCGLVDNLSTTEVFAPMRAKHARWFLTRLGKKAFHLFELA